MNDSIKIGRRYTEKEISEMNRDFLESCFKSELINSMRMSRYYEKKTRTSFFKQILSDIVNCDNIGKLLLLIILAMVALLMSEVVMVALFIYLRLLCVGA